MAKEKARRQPAVLAAPSPLLPPCLSPSPSRPEVYPVCCGTATTNTVITVRG